jgi:hypothetical protein
MRLPVMCRVGHWRETRTPRFQQFSKSEERNERNQSARCSFRITEIFGQHVAEESPQAEETFRAEDVQNWLEAETWFLSVRP